MSDQKPKTNFEAARNFVEMKRGHGQESLSGPGSWLSNTVDSVAFINQVIADKGVRSILDLGCGDWNWFHQVNLEGVNYEGWDADEAMVKMVSEKYGNDSTRFLVKDIVLEDYPKVDLVICRDVLFHMTADIAQSILDKVKANGAYFITTNFRGVTQNQEPVKYTDFDNWGYYDINLNIEPFNLLDNEEQFMEEMANSNQGKNKRYISLYNFNKGA